MWYDFFGLINTVLIFISLYGVYLQLNKLWIRSNKGESKVTHILSQNQFTMSFFAYFSFFIYGYSLDVFNHYIVWPRFLAALLVLLILFEMYKDRKSTASIVSLSFAALLCIAGILGLIFNEVVSTYVKQVSTILLWLLRYYWRKAICTK